MAETGDIDFDEDMGFQRREWGFQRMGWAFLAAFVLAALAGLFGSGPLSRAKVETGVLRVDYERFAHKDAESRLEVTYRRKAGDTSLVLEFDKECLAEMEVEAARPEPKSTMAREGEGLSYVFDLAPEAEWTKLQFHMKPEKAGRRKCKVKAEGLAILEFEQFVYP